MIFLLKGFLKCFNFPVLNPNHISYLIEVIGILSGVPNLSGSNIDLIAAGEYEKLILLISIFE